MSIRVMYVCGGSVFNVKYAIIHNTLAVHMSFLIFIMYYRVLDIENTTAYIPYM